MSSSSEVIVDSRERQNPAHAVLQSDLTFSFVSGDTAEEEFVVNNWDGLLKKVIVVVGTASGAVVTIAFTVKDKDDRTILSDSGLAEGSEASYSLDEPLIGQVKVGVTPNTDPLSAITVTIHLKGV